jgi:phosphomannomutase
MGVEENHGTVCTPDGHFPHKSRKPLPEHLTEISKGGSEEKKLTWVIVVDPDS